MEAKLGKMRILEWIFRVLSVCGCWRPLSWTSPTKKFLYNVYTCVLVSTIYYVTISQCADMVLHTNLDDLHDTIYIFLSLITSCLKMFRLLKGRERIAVFSNLLEKEPFLPRNAEENEIRDKFDRTSRLITIGYTILVEMTACSITLCMVVANVKQRRLPYKIWLPENCSAAFYGISYAQEVIALTTAGMLHVACDSLICGLLIHMCSQIDILGCRLKTLKSGEKGSVEPFVRHHRKIFRFAEMLSDEYRTVIFAQFTISLLLVCTNLYLLATMESFNIKLMMQGAYMSCTLMQIFLFCWFGNELRLKSLEISDMIFAIDWPSQSNDTKKLLLMIMRRATEPIEITSTYVITMNLDSFMALLKMSYSAFNVLQQGKKE